MTDTEQKTNTQTEEVREPSPATQSAPAGDDEVELVQDAEDKDVIEAIPEFDQMGLQKDLLRGIFSYGFTKPSAIQQRAIVPFSKGKDIIAQAQSGTGKTATFAVGILNQVDTKGRDTQALILVPTRELADQVNKVVTALGVHMGVRTHSCTGGTDIREDIRKLNDGVHIVTGTPGRVYHMIQEDILRVDRLRVFALDEADEMLSRGFSEDIRDIFATLPSNVQVGVFSATMPEECLEITKLFMVNPVRVLVKKEELTLMGINQFYIDCQEPRFKYGTLCDLYKAVSIQQAVIFCNSRKTVDWLTDRMTEDGFTVAATHGSIHPADRRKVMEEFRKGGSRVLITTDLLARGIDVQQVSVVINYDLPHDKESYLHRIGRSGRFGRKGLSINFITYRDRRLQDELTTFYDCAIEPLPKNIQDFM
eukprot:TRINITY_DN802_c0_g1_i1.p1 TRINITY_DN802_c0_g1~~TRINITY_DN802_c0_g1_i1.p1  ORF type:complete len:446 (-),score=70.19 TRINITY_DN802_c0_g1_i1:81-1346(-)